MTTENLFEQATRKKLRFKASNGQITTEDLWGLSLEALNTIGMGLRQELRTNEDSLIAAPKTDSTLQLRFDVVKHIIDVKIKEREDKKTQAANAERKKLLTELLEGKQMDKLKGMTEDEIRKELAALDA